MHLATLFRFDSDFRWRPQPPRKKPEKPIVTAVIGFFTKNGIVIATDSQMTNQAAGTKQCDSKKLLQVTFKNGTSALVARAGDIEGADIFQEFFEIAARQTDVTNWRTIADVAETALKESRRKILECVAHPALPPTYAKEHLEGLHNELLLAYKFEGKYFMFSGHSTGAYTVKVTHNFAALGSARNTAGFILEGIDTPSLYNEQALGLAAYTIEMCKKADLYCAGPVQIGVITEEGKVHLVPSSTTALVRDAVEKVHSEMRTTLIREIHTNFRNNYMAVFDRRMKVIGEFISSVGKSAPAKGKSRK